MALRPAASRLANVYFATRARPAIVLRNALTDRVPEAAAADPFDLRGVALLGDELLAHRRDRRDRIVVNLRPGEHGNPLIEQ